MQNPIKPYMRKYANLNGVDIFPLNDNTGLMEIYT